jgi:hypothetical protein
VRHGNATLSHHGHEIPVTQFVAEVPTNAQHHDLLIEVAAFEQFFNVSSRGMCLSSLPQSAFAPEPFEGLFKRLRHHQPPIFKKVRAVFVSDASMPQLLGNQFWSQVRRGNPYSSGGTAALIFLYLAQCDRRVSIDLGINVDRGVVVVRGHCSRIPGRNNANSWAATAKTKVKRPQ